MSPTPTAAKIYQAGHRHVAEPVCWSWPIPRLQSAEEAFAQVMTLQEALPPAERYSAEIVLASLKRCGPVVHRFAEFHGERCALCGRPQGEVALVKDHDHDSGLIRGYLCQGCNSAEGKLLNSDLFKAYRSRYPALMLGHVELYNPQRQAGHTPAFGRLGWRAVAEGLRRVDAMLMMRDLIIVLADAAAIEEPLTAWARSVNRLLYATAKDIDEIRTIVDTIDADPASVLGRRIIKVSNKILDIARGLALHEQFRPPGRDVRGILDLPTGLFATPPVSAGSTTDDDAYLDPWRPPWLR